jgi:4'-phosphopantetheinyl transferase
MNPARASSEPGPAALSASDVHVWSVELDAWLPEIRSLQALLSAEERARAAKFVFGKDGARFVLRRALLRQILGGYAGQKPGLLKFDHTVQGRPLLAHESGGDTLRFSLSHAGGLVLVAVARQRQIGIDVERVREGFEWRPMLDTVFSEAEGIAFNVLPEAQKTGAFFNAWTRKEAYLKATGEGIATSLRQVEMSLRAQKIMRIGGDVAAAAAWSLRDWAPAPGFIASLVVHGHDWRLTLGRWRAGEHPMAAAEPRINVRHETAFLVSS